MSDFDNFFGSDNFSGEIDQETIIIQEDVITCSSIDIEIIQQELVIIQQAMQQIILEQICEVEVQTIVIQQFSSFFSNFYSDVTHSSGRSIGYDSHISSMFGSIYNSDGELNSSNFGFSGSDIGQSYVEVGGSNWNSESSPSSVESAASLAQEALNCSGCT